MNYYNCSIEGLRRELQRRGYEPHGSRDQLGESLQEDDERRGVEATTVTQEVLGPFVPRSLHLSRTSEFGKIASASSLVNESTCY
jgi:hypothetical protein